MFLHLFFLFSFLVSSKYLYTSLRFTLRFSKVYPLFALFHSLYLLISDYFKHLFPPYNCWRFQISFDGSMFHLLYFDCQLFPCGKNFTAFSDGNLFLDKQQTNLQRSLFQFSFHDIMRWQIVSSPPLFRYNPICPNLYHQFLLPRFWLLGLSCP